MGGIDWEIWWEFEGEVSGDVISHVEIKKLV
jgi:hypothetical protein